MRHLILTLICLGKNDYLPPGIFCFITFYKLVQILWHLVKFPKIYLGLIFWIFFSKFELVFGASALFQEQVLFFVYVFHFNEYILCNISRISVQRDSEKPLFNRHDYYELRQLFMGNLIYS